MSAMPEDGTSELTFLRAALTDYQAAFERILTIHGPRYSHPTTCKGCAKPWPCPTTIAALAPGRTP